MGLGGRRGVSGRGNICEAPEATTRRTYFEALKKGRVSQRLESQNGGVRYEAAGVGRSFVTLCGPSGARGACCLFPMATRKPLQGGKQKWEVFVEGMKGCLSYRYDNCTKQYRETGGFDDSTHLS